MRADFDMRSLRPRLPGLFLALLLTIAACAGPGTAPPAPEPSETAAPTSSTTPASPPATTHPSSTPAPAAPASGDEQPTEGELADACTDFSFEVAPLDFDAVAYIIPMGTHSEFKAGLPIPKVYLVLADRSTAREVRAAADGVLFQFLYFEEADGRYDAGVSIAACAGTTVEAQITYSYGHVIPSEKLMALLDEAECLTTPDGVTDCRWEGQLEIEAGEILGYAGGPPSRADALDFELIDRSRSLDVIGPEGFYGGMNFAACPVDRYADASLRSGFEELLARSSVWDPLCGSFDLDVDGALQGPWFHPADLADARPNQARLVGFWPSVVGSPDLGVLTRFEPPGGSRPRYFTYGDDLHNTPPETVTPGDAIYCYDGFVDHPLAGEPVDGHVLVRMDSPTQITYEEAPGPCPTDPWTFETPTSWIRS